MYYLIRFICIIIILSVCFLFLKKKKDKFIGRENRKKRIISIIISVALIGLLFIPYEAPFIRFDSPEASVKYSTIKSDLPLHIVEGKNTAFTLQSNGNTYYYHTIIKYGNKYGFCDFCTQKKMNFDSAIVDDEIFHGQITVDILSNSNTNETCYFIRFLKMKRMEQSKITISDAGNVPINPILQDEKTIVFAYVADTGDKSFTFLYNGQRYKI